MRDRTRGKPSPLQAPTNFKIHTSRFFPCPYSVGTRRDNVICIEHRDIFFI